MGGKEENQGPGVDTFVDLKLGSSECFRQLVSILYLKQRKSSIEEGQWLVERIEESVEALKQPLSGSGSESLLVKQRSVGWHEKFS